MIGPLPAEIWALVSEKLPYRDWVRLRSACMGLRLVLAFHTERYTPVMIVRVAPGDDRCQCRLYFDRLASVYVRLAGKSACEEHALYGEVMTGKNRRLAV
jgi:hypothetical protein